MKKVSVVLIVALVVVTALGSVVLAQEKSPIEVTGIDMEQSVYEVTVGVPIQINAFISPSNATNANLIWSTGDSTIAVVEQVGFADSGIARLRGLAPGTTTVTVRSDENSAIFDVATVRVRAATTTPPTGGGSVVLYLVLAGTLVSSAIIVKRLRG